MNLLTVVGVGFLLGMRHATDPDHVIAVSTIVSHQGNMRHAGLIGILWGLGHTITILFVGAAIILFNLAIPARVGLTMELAVGMMLILLGVLNLTGVTQRVTNRFTPGASDAEVIHLHTHQHGGLTHSHVHGHRPEVHMHLDRSFESHSPNATHPIGRYQIFRPVVVGIVHGLAGSAAVALLVLSTVHDTRWAIAYLLVFGVGTIAGMMIVTAIIGAPFAYAGSRFGSFNRFLGVASGLISVAFGLFIIFQIGFVDGLFTAHPHWTPH